MLQGKINRSSSNCGRSGRSGSIVVVLVKVVVYSCGGGVSEDVLQSSISKFDSRSSSSNRGKGNISCLLRLFCCKGDDCKEFHGDIDGAHRDSVR